MTIKEAFKRAKRYARNFIIVKKNLKEYNRKNTNGAFARDRKYDYFCIKDMNSEAANLKSYFWQDLWAARLIIKNRPNIHYDIGSRIDGFIGHLSAADINVTLIDIRPMSCDIPNVDFICSDATTLREIEDESIGSISALCSLEHFGLGRYGDPIEPNACFEAMHSITRVLDRGGHAYIAVPVGWEHLEYNAHRIFFAKTITENFAPLKLVEYSVADRHGIHKVDGLNQYDCDKNNRGDLFGLFHFVKE